MLNLAKIEKRILLFVCQIMLIINLNGQNKTAQTPPMGWNSYDCYGASVTEAEVKSNADMMAAHLKDYGWEYIVVDYCWYYPYSGAMNNCPQDENYKPTLAMDQYGRLLPAIDKFPSAIDGKGFKPLADYVHSKGLKFGIHVMRGIPRQAVSVNSPVKNSVSFAKDIGDTSSICSWLNSMYGVDCIKKGAQEYYNSIINLYADWGVDYIKVDDLSMPYSSLEIEAIRKAIDQCGREIVFSLSPGATPIDQAEHVKKYANSWRISVDFWDNWEALKKQFDRCNLWSAHSGEGHWADVDMIPIGRLNRRGPNKGMERESNFTYEEQKTLMSLWSIFRSPLMIGGDLKLLTNEMKNLFTNKEVLEVNQNSIDNHQFSRIEEKVIWVANIPGTKNKYVALFNIGNEDASIELKLKEIGIQGNCEIRDLWKRNTIGQFSNLFTCKVEPHGVVLVKITPQ